MLKTAFIHRFAYWLVFAALVGQPVRAGGVEIDGFTEPYYDIEVAAAEVGIIDEIAVKEGDQVVVGQLLAQLDTDVLEATLNIARTAMESRGRLDSAIEELALQTEIVDKLEQLLLKQHASFQEVERAAAQKRIADAQLRAVQEEQEVKMLEYERARLQLERRRLTAPINGIVTQIFRDPGEFVSPSSPVILRIVQLDPLLVVFLVPAEVSRGLKVDQPVSVRIERSPVVEGNVEFVSPTADPQSGTARVRVRIPNPQAKLPSGAPCRLLLTDTSAPLSGAARP